MPKMNESESDTFLAEPGVVMKIATVRPDGSPLVAPIWFVHEDGSIWFTPRERSEWFSNLRADPRVCLCIDEQPLPYRKVVVEGSAELVHDVGEDDVWRDRYRRIACRYVEEDAAESYVQETIDQPRALYRVPLASSKVRTWRMPGPDEDFAGIWHPRYYAAGSKLGAG